MSKLALTTEGETHVVVKRRFEAPPEAVYRAHLDPELLQQWCLGPEGWTMPVCINEGRPGGKIRYEWANGKGAGFFLTGEISSSIHRIASCTSSACTCLIPRPTTASSRPSWLTARGR